MHDDAGESIRTSHTSSRSCYPSLACTLRACWRRLTQPLIPLFRLALTMQTLVQAVGDQLKLPSQATTKRALFSPLRILVSMSPREVGGWQAELSYSITASGTHFLTAARHVTSAPCVLFRIAKVSGNDHRQCSVNRPNPQYGSRSIPSNDMAWHVSASKVASFIEIRMIQLNRSPQQRAKTTARRT